MWLCAYRHLFSKFSIRKDQVPVTCVELSSVRECCENTELMYVYNLWFYTNCVHLFNVGDYSPMHVTNNIKNNIKYSRHSFFTLDPIIFCCIDGWMDWHDTTNGCFGFYLGMHLVIYWITWHGLCRVTWRLVLKFLSAAKYHIETLILLKGAEEAQDIWQE
jgi:hypothetical protein